jgi:hypothetical protein
MAFEQYFNQRFSVEVSHAKNEQTSPELDDDSIIRSIKVFSVGGVVAAATATAAGVVNTKTFTPRSH